MSGSDHIRSTGRGRLTSGSARVLATLPGALVRMLRQPVVPVLMIAGVVDAISGSPVGHGMMLIVVAVGLALDTIRRRNAQPAAPAEVEEHGGADAFVVLAERPQPHAPAFLRPAPRLFLGGLAYAVIVGAFARYSWPVTVAVMAPGVAAIAISWAAPSRGEPESVGRFGAGAWATVFIALGLWELAALLLQPDLVTMSWAHPTISYLMDPVLASHAGRSATLFLWLVFGWFLLER